MADLQNCMIRNIQSARVLHALPACPKAPLDVNPTLSLRWELELDWINRGIFVGAQL